MVLICFDKVLQTFLLINIVHVQTLSVITNCCQCLLHCQEDVILSFKIKHYGPNAFKKSHTVTVVVLGLEILVSLQLVLHELATLSQNDGR